MILAVEPSGIGGRKEVTMLFLLLYLVGGRPPYQLGSIGFMSI
jgi:hypothetical protein